MGSKKHSKRSKESSSDLKKSKKSKKRRRKDASSLHPPNGRDLLIASSLGDHRRCRELLRQGADIDWSDGDLTTPLHAASRTGYLKTVQLLLRKGANASLQDLKGETPAHLAARMLHLDVLSALLRSKTIGSLQEPNDKGETVEQLTAKAMEQQEIQAKLAAEAKFAEKRYGGRGGSSFSFLDEEESEFDWEERLRRELSPVGEEAYYSYNNSTWHADQFETAEEYAKRIWMEMDERKLRKEKESAFAYSQQRQKQQQAAEKDREGVEQDEGKRKRKRQEKQEKEEERQRDVDWREAKAAGSATLKRASYEARWEFFCTKNKGKIATFADIPWILTPSTQKINNLATTSSTNSLLAELESVLLSTADSTQEQRQILRRELIRWHPDKFIGKFGALLDPGQRDMILNAVNDLSQQLTQLLAKTTASKSTAH